MRTKILVLITTVLLLTLSLGVYASEIQQWAQGNPLLAAFIRYSPSDPDNGDAANGKGKALEPLYVTVLEEDPVYGLTFQEMNGLEQIESIAKESRLPIALRIGAPQTVEKGPPSSGDNGTVSHATIEQRGYSVRLAELKSYKIRLNGGEERWNQQEIINLNKHPYDYTRVRNKLSFDYFHMIPHLFSMDTQFVQLHVKDLTANPPSQAFIDYGLFTHIEQPNGDFLRRNGLDPDGYLYKAINFEFHRYPEVIRERDDPFYDKEAFEEILGIKGREYHGKLIAMLEDVNDESKDFEQVFNKHFDRDNFLTWVAVNLIMGNLDTTGNNFYLYSSRYSDTWYFLPWDYDKAWNYDWQWGNGGEGIHPAREGLSLYWGWPLAQRFFQNPENVKALNEKMTELSQIITEEQTRKFLDAYYPTVKPFVLQSPDVQLLPEDVKRFDEEYYSLAAIPAKNIQKYYANLEKPMPIFIGGPWVDGEQMTFTWGESHDLQKNDIFYDVQISTSPDFAQIMYEQKGLRTHELTVDLLPPGVYYWRVLIRDDQGNEQVAFESYVNGEGRIFHGVKPFTLE